MAANPFLDASDFTDNEKAYLSLLESIQARVPDKEISIFRLPISTRNDLLKTIVWKKPSQQGFYLANTANYTNERIEKQGKRADLYFDSSFKFWTLKNEKEFSESLTSFIVQYYPHLQMTLSIPDMPTTNYKERFYRHYTASIELLLRGPPHADEHQIDATLAEEWIQSHKSPEHKRLARLLIDNTLYISHSELLQQIQRTVQLVQEKLVPGLPIIFLTGLPSKSNYYISLLFYHFWTMAGLSVDTCKVYMDEIVAGNIIDIDEMAYTGTQTTGTLSKVYLGLVNKIVGTLVKANCTDASLKPFCESRNFYPVALFEQLLAAANVNYILVRIFCSEQGETELLRIPHSSYDNPLKLPSHLVIGKRIPSPKTLFGKENATKLSILYGSPPGFPASAVYFNHKIANSPSTFLNPYAYGVVPDAPLLSSDEFWTRDKNEQAEFNKAMHNLKRPENTDTVEFKPFIRYCLPGTRRLPKTRKNLINYEDPNGGNGFRINQATLPQEYRCPYSWYKRIDYDTGTYSPLPGTNGKGGSRRTKKTRKLRGGAGFFSMTSKGTSVTPKPQSLPFESYLSSIHRLYLFLYSKVKPTTPGYLPLTNGQTSLSQEQKDFFRSLVEPYRTTNDINEDFVRDVLGVDSIQTLNRQIQESEAVNTVVYDSVLNRPAIAQSFAGSWGRFLPVVNTSEKQLIYRQNWEQHICSYDPKVNQNSPIKSLTEKRCILIYHRKTDFAMIEAEFQLTYGDDREMGPGFPSLFVESDFMPLTNGIPFPYTLLDASTLMKTSFVLDAFINNGVKEIQPSLAETIEKEYKRLWNQYSLVKVVQHKMIRRHDIYNQKFISVTDDFPVASGSYSLLSTLPSLDQVKGMDVQSSLQLRVRYPTIWSTGGPYPDPNLSFFVGLSYPDQIRFAVLQFKQYLKVLPTNPDTAFRTVFWTDLKVSTTKELFLRNIEADEVDSYRALLNRHR
jgi:hypothetical protein